MTDNSITVDDFLSHRKANPKSVVIDVRDSERFSEAHIPGAINIYKTEVASEIEKAIPDKTTEIYCHCGGGQSGPRAAELLNEMGYKNAKYIIGGWRGYEAKVKDKS